MWCAARVRKNRRTSNSQDCLMNTKKIIVTGAPGTIGRRLTLRLLEAGYNIHSVDIKPWPGAPCPHISADLRNLGEAADAFNGADTVIHLAAVRGGEMITDGETFNQNVVSAFNAFWAAKLVGVRRVLWSSSSHAAGQPYNAKCMPSAIPLIESELQECGDTYGISKTSIESILAHKRLWSGIQIAALRVGFAYEDSDYEFLYKVDCPRVFANPVERLPNLWGYVDGRDVFQAFRKAIESPADLSGEILFVTSNETFMNRPTRQLITEFAPGTKVPGNLPEFGGFYSIDRTRKILGYEPQHSWREFVAL
jgi:nucleoside-diphosphate-sugar epimerase